MKMIDETGLKLCKLQANIFEKSVIKTECSSAVFVRRFMLSDVARRMDEGVFLFEACSEDDVFAEIENQYGKSNYGKEKISSEELYWIGYIYRYWSYIYQMTSKQVFKTIKTKELRDLYYPYHSLDPASAIERILEAKGKLEEDFIKRGVEILRRIDNQKNKKLFQDDN